MKLSLLVENKTYREGIHAEHELSLLIETDEKTILFKRIKPTLYF